MDQNDEDLLRAVDDRKNEKKIGLDIGYVQELGFHLDKSQQTSDWSQRPLTLEQVEYAALDAEVLLRVGPKLRGSL